MISVLFCSRVQDNPDSNLPRLLDSAVEHTTEEERKQIEFLIKYDEDDRMRPPESFFAKYPFAIRTFTYSRGDGRHSLHHAQEYMFAQRDPSSRFCLMTADDFYFTRPGFVSEILSIKDEFVILGHRRPPIESYAGIYEQEDAVRQWVVSFGLWSPVVSARVIEVCQNFGWQANVDSWLMGLSVVLYDLYKIVIWKTHEPFYERGGCFERPASIGAAPTYNNMELTNNVGPLNKYWFELLRRQARNIYLNMMNTTDFHTLARRPLWQKVRRPADQPLAATHLPTIVLGTWGCIAVLLADPNVVQASRLPFPHTSPSLVPGLGDRRGWASETLALRKSASETIKMNLGLKTKIPFPAVYKSFRLMRTHGRIFATPAQLNPKTLLNQGTLFTHPAVQSAATLTELQELLDGSDEAPERPRMVGQYQGYDLFSLRDDYHAVPCAVEEIDLELPEERRRAGVLSAASQAELEAAIRELASAEPVEFAGWLPIYKVSGNCGQHPQFTHTINPPAGYRFTRSVPPETKRASLWSQVSGRLFDLTSRAITTFMLLARMISAFIRPRRGISLRARVRVFAALVRLSIKLLGAGCQPRAILRFLITRHLQSQLLMGDKRDLVFLTSMPYTFGQNPWVIEIEDPTTLFFPMIQNGHTCGLRIQDAPCLPVVKTLLEANHCKAILTHMKSTAELLPTLFGSEIIRDKVVYAPLGVKLPARWQRHEPAPADEEIHLLFINSWCQIPENFYVRGGLDLLEAFATLRVRYPQLRLTLRTALPALADHYHQLIESNWIRIIHRFLTPEEMAELHAESHIFLLPAARVHIVSLLQAMSYGLAVVASDGWGIEEYIDHERTGLIVKGRYGKTSWADEEAGILRENYEPTYTPDPEVIQGIVDAVSRLVEDHKLRARLGRAARVEVETRFNMQNWNNALKTAFDRAKETGPDRNSNFTFHPEEMRQVRAG